MLSDQDFVSFPYLEIVNISEDHQFNSMLT